MSISNPNDFIINIRKYKYKNISSSTSMCQIIHIQESQIKLGVKNKVMWRKR